MKHLERQPDNGDIASLCADYLAAEETLVTEALRLVRATRARFARADSPPEPAESYHRLAGFVDDMKIRRQLFRMNLARRLHCDTERITLTWVLAGLPAHQRDVIAPSAERVRTLTGELVTLNYWLAVHLRIHLDAYQRLLCDLTGTSNHSGRYGPAGKTEVGDFRPVIQVKG